MKRVTLQMLRWYRIFLSPIKGPTCRFFPSCSAYTIESIEKKGLCRGSIAGFLRIMRCHPFSRGGYDPVK